MVEYKVVPDYPKYQVNTKGEIFNISNGNILKPMQTIHGYLRVGLYNENGMKKIVVHRLVAIAFIPNPENKPEVNHKDGDKQNNHKNNLEWSTRHENMQHCDLFGLRKMPNGQKHHKSTITNEQALIIRDSKIKTSILAKNYNVSFSTIYNIKNKISRKHL